MKRFLIVCFLVGATVVCKAEAPDCTANRHFDTCAQFCPDPPPTTSTTIPDTDGGVCLTLNEFRFYMKHLKDTDTDGVAMAYIPCKYVKASTKYPLGVRCAKPHYHGRVIVPVRNPMVPK